MTTRGDRFADELITWVRTPMIWQSCVKGLQGGVDCKMLMVGAARECGFPEAQSLYASMADYNKMRRVPTQTLFEGMCSLFDRVPFARGQLVPEEAQRGDILLVRMAGRPQHLAGIVSPGPQGTAVHVQLGPKDWVKETRLDVLLRAYPLHSIFRWRDE
jgi:hypothetical protein